MPGIVILTDPTGTEWTLDGSVDIWVQPGRKGFHAPSYTHYMDVSPAVAGALHRGVQVLPRDLYLPIVVRNQDRNLALARRRSLIKAISPTKGECILTSSWPDGSIRRIRCRYVDGIDAGEQGPGEYGITTMKYGLRFIAEEPYWYGDEIIQDWQLGVQTRTELPMPGADTFYEVVSSSMLAGGVVITNPGDVASYPTWVFTGPFTSIVAENETSDKTFTITHTAAGIANTLSLVTSDKGEAYLVDETGANQWSKLVAGYDLWPLENGDNVINITLTGATSDSVARLSYTPLYEAD